MRNPIPTVWITLGEGVELSLDGLDRIVLSHDDHHIAIGPATKKRIEELQSYLERLKVHCT